MFFIFSEDRKIVLSSNSKIFEELKSKSAFINMLCRREESIAYLNGFSLFSFQCMLDCIKNNVSCKLDDFYAIVDISCYFMLDESLLDNILPMIPASEKKVYLKAMHTLISNGYVDLVKKRFRECRIPEFLITEKFHRSYHKWKKAYTRAARFQNWYVAYCQPFCKCTKCTEFRHQRLIQFWTGEYSTPSFEVFRKTPLSEKK